MSESRAYFDLSADDALACVKCGWEGRLADVSPELFSELAVYECPRCEASVLTVTYPTDVERQAAAAAGSQLARDELQDETHGPDR